MRINKRKILKYSLLSLLIVALGYGVYRFVDKGYRVFQSVKIKNAMIERYESFEKICLQGIDRNNHSMVLDMMRHCVHKNSLHRIDEEFYALGEQGEHAYAENVIQYAEGKLKKLPHLECSMRSITLTSVYRELGYKARNIIVARHAPKFPDHVVTEVYNPQTADWEMQDASYDIHMKDKKSAKRLNASDAVKLPYEDYNPCNIDGYCGWDIVSFDKTSSADRLKLFWGMAFLGSYDDVKRGPLIYNPDKFAIEVSYTIGEKDISYCDKRPRHCKKIINLKTQNYSYDGVNPR